MDKSARVRSHTPSASGRTGDTTTDATDVKGQGKIRNYLMPMNLTLQIK